MSKNSMFLSMELCMQLCRQFEEAFGKSVDGGKGGGEQILHVFEKRLTDNIRKLDFDKILDPANVRRIVEEADGYQPHLIAPEMGYRRLLQVLPPAALKVLLQRALIRDRI